MDQRRSAPMVRGRRGPCQLRVRGITTRFGGVVANREISFEVAPGELVGVIGPNGAGKSTQFEGQAYA